MKRWIFQLLTLMGGTCRQATVGCTDHAEGALSRGDRARTLVHLTICGPCRAFRWQMRAARDVLRGLPREGLTPQERDLLAQRFRQRRSG